jgi:hypothetical protein
MTTTEPSYTILSSQRVDGGIYHRIKHPSSSTGVDMTFGLFVPSRYVNDVAIAVPEEGSKTKKMGTVPVMFWLSGLTCDGEL